MSHAIRAIFLVCLLAPTPMAAGDDEGRSPSNKVAPTTTAETAKLNQRGYQPPSAPLIYVIETKTDFADQQYDRKHQITLRYEIEKRKTGDLSVSARFCRSQPYVRSRKVAPSSFQLGPFEAKPFPGQSVIAANGDLVEIGRPLWLSGLPVNAVQLPFPSIRDLARWQSSETVTLVPNFHAVGYRQLVPVSEQVKPDRYLMDHWRRTKKAGKEPIMGTLTTQCTVKRETNDSVEIEESYSLQGASIEPLLRLTGQGSVEYSKTDQLVNSIHRRFNFTMISGSDKRTVPVELDVRRLSGTSLKSVLDAEQAYQDRSKRRQSERVASEDAMPGIENRDAIVQILRGDDPNSYRNMVTRLFKDETKNDPEMARIIYKRFFREPASATYSVGVISNLDPSLKETAELRFQYATPGVKDQLVGNGVTADTKLIKNQMVLYPRYRSWVTGSYYGAVKDVLVIDSKRSRNPLVVIKRDECRLPVDAFWDPVVDPDR